MSGWRNGYEEYPWCPQAAPCISGKRTCDVCREVVIAMDLMEHAIISEKHRNDAEFNLHRQKVTALELQVRALQEIVERGIEKGTGYGAGYISGLRLRAEDAEQQNHALMAVAEAAKAALGCCDYGCDQLDECDHKNCCALDVKVIEALRAVGYAQKPKREGPIMHAPGCIGYLCNCKPVFGEKRKGLTEGPTNPPEPAPRVERQNPEAGEF